MFFCTDVQYDEASSTAVAAAIGFWHSADHASSRRYTTSFTGIEAYQPGEFYRRELPCLVGVLERARCDEDLDLILVDGHVWLGRGEPGLGHHLWRVLGEQVPVVGVAKRPWHDGVALEVTRGRSRRPLYVSAIGVAPDEAAAFVRRMHGPHRIPTLLAEVDALCRYPRDRDP